MRIVLAIWIGVNSMLGRAANLPEYPELHAVINAHLLAEKENYLGNVSFKQIVPSEYRTHLIDLNDDGIKDALVLMLGSDWGGQEGKLYLFFGE